MADYRSVVGYFTQTVMKDLRLVGGYDIHYGKVKEFVRDRLFGRAVELEEQTRCGISPSLPPRKRCWKRPRRRSTH